MLKSIKQILGEDPSLPQQRAHREKINKARLWLDANWERLDKDKSTEVLYQYEGLIDDYREKYDPEWLQVVG